MRGGEKANHRFASIARILRLAMHMAELWRLCESRSTIQENNGPGGRLWRSIQDEFRCHARTWTSIVEPGRILADQALPAEELGAA